MEAKRIRIEQISKISCGKNDFKAKSINTAIVTGTTMQTICDMPKSCPANGND